jgi:hypothetical protein
MVSMLRFLNGRILLSLGALACLHGCATGAGLDGEFGGNDDRGDGDARTLDERMASRVSLSVQAEDVAGSGLHLTAASLTDDVSVEVGLRVTGGAVTVSLEPDGAAGERLAFHDLTLTAEDVEVAPSIVPPRGLLLTGLSMELEQPASAALGWHNDDGIGADASLSVDIQWAVELESGTVDLAPIHMPSLPFEVTVEDDGEGRLVAHLRGSSAGPFWSWAGIFELRDLELDLVAVAD